MSLILALAGASMPGTGALNGRKRKRKIQIVIQSEPQSWQTDLYTIVQVVNVVLHIGFIQLAVVLSFFVLCFECLNLDEFCNPHQTPRKQLNLVLEVQLHVISYHLLPKYSLVNHSSSTFILMFFAHDFYINVACIVWN